jgi:uncharacterized damage-inducible protein DinB
MQISELRLLYDYSYWATGRILEAVERLGPERFTAIQGHGCGSLQSTLVHMLSAEWIWRTRCQEGVSPTAMLDPRDFPTLAALRERWATEEAAMRGYLAQLDDEALRQQVGYARTGGQRCEDVLWHLLLHTVNHGTQHRAEVAAMLTEHGHSPGDVDLIIFLRERSQVPSS